MQEIANILLDIKAVHLNTQELFTWVSGIKSPIYCDNRQIISHPRERKIVATAMANIIEAKFSDCQIIAATATAGIPHGAWVADILDLPLIYVRSSNKAHGRGNQIEGAYSKGQKVVLIEDLISTGKSSVAAVEALEQEGLEVQHTLSIFTYGLKKSANKFKEAGHDFTSLCHVDQLVESAIAKNKIKEEDIEIIKNFFIGLDLD